MSSLPTWTVWEIVAACSLLGSVIAFLVVLAVAVLDRWISMAREASPRPAPEPAQSEPAVRPAGVVADTSRMRTAGAARIAGGTSKQAAGDARNPPAEYRKRQPHPTCLIPCRLLQSCRRPKKAISRRARNLAQQRNQCVTHDNRHAEYAASTRSLHRFMMVVTGRLQCARNAQFRYWERSNAET